MSKRARDETEEIIQAALKEDQETKSLQKRGKVKGSWPGPQPGRAGRWCTVCLAPHAGF